MKKWMIGIGILVIVSVTGFGVESEKKQGIYEKKPEIQVQKEHNLTREESMTKVIQSIQEKVLEDEKQQIGHIQEAKVRIDEYDNYTYIEIYDYESPLGNEIIEILQNHMDIENLKEVLDYGFENRNGQQIADESSQVIIDFYTTNDGRTAKFELPHKKILIPDYEELDAIIGGEGYVLNEILTKGKNQVLIYKDIPSRADRNYLVGTQVKETSGLTIELEISKEEIVRISGKVVDTLESGQEIVFEEYQKEMLGRILGYWGMNEIEQEGIWEYIEEDVQEQSKGKQGGIVTTNGNYNYDSRTVKRDYGSGYKEYFMKFDITK